MKLRLGVRGSALALARSEFVAGRLRDAGHEVEVVQVTTEAADASHMADGYSVLSFAGELRDALRDGKCDVVVHSHKDLPLSNYPEDLTIAAVPKRGDHRDVLVSLSGRPLAALPRKSRVGVSALRRMAQVRALRPDLTFVEVGGTAEERFRRVEPGDLDAIVISAIAAKSLGHEGRIAEYLPILPAPGQGALALECPRDASDVIEALSVIDDIETRICVEAERAVLTGLHTTYLAPVGAIASRRGVLGLKAGVFSVDGTKRVVLEIGLPTSHLHAERTGHNVANALLQRRADRFIAPEVLANVDLNAEQVDPESMFVESAADDDRVRVLLPRLEGRLATSLRSNGLRVDCVTLQEGKLIAADNLMRGADWVVIPSGQTMWALRERGWDIPDGAKVAAMGTTTQQIVEEAGYTVTLCPEGTASSQRLVEMFPPAEGDQRVVIPGPRQLSTKLEEGLRDKGYAVERNEIYSMEDVAEIEPELRAKWDAGTWDAILLSQPSTAEAYINVLGNRDDVLALAWDDETASVLEAAGVPVFETAKSKDVYGVAALARALKGHFNRE
ncbi:hydroxymethylbilane synthase [Tessaracoccus lacteus]|uniref:Hydroxymethylbilane synthase n=1 Tax=Tessaracoccus lacteus TaxID=3041766 RepID=A0ABY8Q0U0_9ACTN|nr:hydroxymethylbilane synthase [Tessaracoccus sp. T21]WGT48191.1 hydroxymethylbilane synthase [Tessaracoccus sp. T21]